ncbi:hypothetical protein Hanom_Chr06g00538721 [Helianthus anomalus]
MVQDGFLLSNPRTHIRQWELCVTCVKPHHQIPKSPSSSDFKHHQISKSPLSSWIQP